MCASRPSLRLARSRYPRETASGSTRARCHPGTETSEGRDAYSFADFDRRSAVLWLSIAFVVLLLATGRMHGLRALVGLAASLFVVVKFIVPAILEGSPPLAVAIVGAFAVHAGDDAAVLRARCEGDGRLAGYGGQPADRGRTRVRLRGNRPPERCGLR
jgi:hypothetical protein